MKLLPTSLASRLLLVAAGLVAVVGLLVAFSTTYAMNHYLTSQLDAQVKENANRVGRFVGNPDRGGDPPAGFPQGGSEGEQGPSLAPRGALTAVVIDGTATGTVFAPTSTDFANQVALDDEAEATLAAVPTGEVTTVNLGEHGTYRVLAQTVHASDTSSQVLITGLSLHDVMETTRNIALWLLALTALGVLAATLAGQRLIRRTLRPLRQVAATAHEVTALPLESGLVGETARVPEALTDPDTEVGQVGAALNKLLGHVESALDARHRSEQQVRQFVADASHELRTPLSTIKGYAELARRSPSYDANEALLKVEEEGARMSMLVEDLLLLARLDSGRPLVKEEVDLTKLALEAVEDARVLAKDHRWSLELPEEPVTVVGDDQRLHQVLSNLLTNARRHTPTGTTVQVRLALAGDLAVLTVHDNGPGVPADLQPHIFERFTRADSSRTRDSGGAGLGLALVHAIVTAQGGSVGLASRPGDTTFTVTLPRPRAAVVELVETHGGLDRLDQR